jgi:hypothetical protein
MSNSCVSQLNSGCYSKVVTKGACFSIIFNFLIEYTNCITKRNLAALVSRGQRLKSQASISLLYLATLFINSIVT